MPDFLPVAEQLSQLRRGAAQVETIDELKKKLEKSRATGTPLRIKYGIDPTGFDVHLGHTVPLRKLRQFQSLGHTAVLIIGTATAQVGDPSGRDESRQGLSPEQIDTNAKSYLTQIAKVIDVEKAEVTYNGDWFRKFDFAAMLRLLGSTTVQRMLERDDFSKRFRSDPSVPIYLHECLYPLLQGQDSVEIRADVELGGTEQLFNLMVGRDLQRSAGQEPQICFTLPILRGTDGEKKMGKSVGNYIGLNEPPKEQFGKTMRIPDANMREWFELLTDIPTAEIDALLAGKPNEAKKRLGAEVVRFYHGQAAAEAVLSDWKKQFEEKGDPENIPDYIIPLERTVNNHISLLDLLVLINFCRSKSDARVKIGEGAVNYGPNKIKVKDWKLSIDISSPIIIRLGRRVATVHI
ncbi:MAG TPA: tyrosine--tRNA ligase [Fimbriiglobus sp.]|jgi:tyrosyl-tRNA synthetase